MLGGLFHSVPCRHLADNPTAPAFVRFWTKADKIEFWPKAVCRLMTHRGFLSRVGIFNSARLRLQPRLDGFEQPKAHRAVVACERDHEAYSPMVGRVGIARQGADAGNGAGLEERAVAAA